MLQFNGNCSIVGRPNFTADCKHMVTAWLRSARSANLFSSVWGAAQSPAPKREANHVQTHYPGTI